MYIQTFQGLRQPRFGEPPTASPDADQRFKRAAALVTDGLKIAKDAIPQLSTNAQQDLVRFMTSLLSDNFFPLGHGLVDAPGNVLRQSQVATIQIPVVVKDGSRWPFEHRVRLYLNDQAGTSMAGEHQMGHFTSIRLFVQRMQKMTPGSAIHLANHEMTHMMFAMIRRFEQRFGADIAARLLSRQPWRLLVLRGFEPHRERLEQHVRHLLRVLPIPMMAAELAKSLIEEAFAFVFGEIVDAAIAKSIHLKSGKRGPSIVASSAFEPKRFIGYYVLERGFAITKAQLDSRGAQQVFAGMAKDVEALAAALRAHLNS